MYSDPAPELVQGDKVAGMTAERDVTGPFALLRVTRSIENAAQLMRGILHNYT